MEILRLTNKILILKELRGIVLYRSFSHISWSVDRAERLATQISVIDIATRKGHYNDKILGAE